MDRLNKTACITMFVSLMISLVSAYCTVVGTGKVFASAPYVTMFIASVIELGRVVLIYDLHHYWDKLKLKHKVPGICMLLIAITLSAMGIFGFMSNAHSQRTQEIIPIEMVIEQKNKEISMIETTISRNNEMIHSFDNKAYDKLTDMGYVSKALKAKKEQNDSLSELYNENKGLQEKINGLNKEILELQLEAEKKAPTLAHLKYYAKFLHVDNDTAVIIFIVMIMLVFDTLAMYLMITADLINKFDEKNIEEPVRKVYNTIRRRKELEDILKPKKERIHGLKNRRKRKENKEVKEPEYIVRDTVNNSVDEKVDRLVDLIKKDRDVIDTTAFAESILENPEISDKLKERLGFDSTIAKRLDANISRRKVGE